jgi:chitosanase
LARHPAGALAGSVAGLEGIDRAWAAAAKDPRFIKVQDEVVEQLYYRPTMKSADSLGLRSALGRTILYDTIIQHGNTPAPDSLPALIARTNKAAGGSPASGVPETRWLQVFLRVRRADLAHAYDPTTREVWAESVARVDALSSLLASHNMKLDAFHLDAAGYNVRIH